jgi:hypothetical protein
VGNVEHSHVLAQGVASLNNWRGDHPTFRPNLSYADLGSSELAGADLSFTDLGSADLSYANLTGADLRVADLGGANLGHAKLARADLRGAYLLEAVLRATDVDEAQLAEAFVGDTVFADIDLSSCHGLDTCHHFGPSFIDFRVLERSGPLPLAFLRGVGLPDRLIEYLPSLLEQAIQLYSCFISYSSRDEDFARRLHADLQDRGVRCWFAPEDMKIWAKILDTLDEAVRLRDKVLLVLSEASIKSEWVEDEVTRAFAEERSRGITVLFPVRIDDAVFETKEAWAVKLGEGRHIGDFRRWKDHDSYRQALARVLRDLTVEPKGTR